MKSESPIPNETKSIVNWRGKGACAYESAWCVVHKLAYLNSINSKDVWLFIFDRRWNTSLRWDMRYWPKDCTGFSERFQSTFSGIRFSTDTMVVAEFLPLGGVKNDTITSRFLRYCPDCIQNGYHCALFQSRWLYNCPIHHRRLADKCPHCGLQIPYIFDAHALDVPYGCPSCHGLLWPGRDEDCWSPVSLEVTKPIDAYLELTSLIRSNPYNYRSYRHYSTSLEDTDWEEQAIEEYVLQMKEWLQLYSLDKINKNDWVPIVTYTTTITHVQNETIPAEFNISLNELHKNHVHAGSVASDFAVLWHNEMNKRMDRIVKSMRRTFVKSFKQHGDCIAASHKNFDLSHREQSHSRTPCEIARAYLLWLSVWEKRLRSKWWSDTNTIWSGYKMVESINDKDGDTLTKKRRDTQWDVSLSQIERNLHEASSYHEVRNILLDLNRLTQLHMRIFAQSIWDSFFFFWMLTNVYKVHAYPESFQWSSRDWPYLLEQEITEGNKTISRLVATRSHDQSYQEVIAQVQRVSSGHKRHVFRYLKCRRKAHLKHYQEVWDRAFK